MKKAPLDMLCIISQKQGLMLTTVVVKRFTTSIECKDMSMLTNTAKEKKFHQIQFFQRTFGAFGIS